MPTDKISLRLIDPATFTTGYSAECTGNQSGDLATAAALVSDRAKTPAVDGVRSYTPEPTADAFVGPVTSTSTTYVNSTSIDMADYDRINVFPNKTTGAVAGDSQYKLQWSHDATNWTDDVTQAAAVTTAVLITTTTNVAAGYTAAQSYNRQKQARYCRIAQQSKTAATHTFEYHYTLL